MILDTFCLISTLNIAVIINLASTSCQTGDSLDAVPSLNTRAQQQQDRRGESNINVVAPPLNVTQLLYNRFYHLFQDTAAAKNQTIQPLSLSGGSIVVNNETITTTTNYETTTENQQSILETRKIDQDGHLRANSAAAGNNQQQHRQHSSDELNRRNYFKIINRVFSRVDLPEVYKTSRLRGGHCGSHIGCVEEIPNFPSLLKKANVSSSFTVYTRENAKIGHKILYEPIVHHQLQDASTTESELEEKLKNLSINNNNNNNRPTQLVGIPTLTSQHNQKRQTAVSWRTAAKIIHSQEYPFDMAALEQCGFNASLNTRIIVGGYFAKEDEEWIDEVVKQWLLLEPSNIIKVSWADANRGLYHTAAYNSRIVGRQLTLFLYYLDQMFHIDLARFHLVGHSLGAHIAGFVGADNEGKIARITGLDPAGPIFVELNASMRLDPSDAKFVDVVHTNGGTITKGALGLSTPSGHVDYYCNGGSLQPGCYFSSVTKSIMDPVERVACSHRRSYRYFIEIIKLTISEMLNSNHQQQLTYRDSLTCLEDQCQSGLKSSQMSHLPRAFLFEAKHDDLVRLTQPEIVSLSSSSMRREVSDLAPLKRRLEFHLLNPDFPPGKRGMYFFKTRTESPFFATKQYALTFKTDVVIRRKIAIMAKIDHTLVAEAELDEIPGVYTLAFAPNDPRIVNISDENRVPQLSLMWKHRSFNLLLNQQNELHLAGLELSLLDSDEEQPPVIKYTLSQGGISSSLSGLSKSGFVGDMALIRNQWHKFEGKLAKPDRTV